MKEESNLTTTSHDEDLELIRQSLETATETQVVELGAGVLDRTHEVFAKCFGDVPAVIVADRNTLEVAGKRVCQLLRWKGHTVLEPVLIPGQEPAAKYNLVTDLADALRKESSIAVAVGSGTVNDITKLASHQLGRKYMSVGTAASMDGYTAFGASITRDGFKITIPCAAPLAVVADTEIFSQAPAGMNASGYADLLAKVTAGADWLLADALGIEPINAIAWSLVQDRLREWVGDPEGIRSGSPKAAEALMVGLLMAGLAMQSSMSSRPASGAEHQFSHLWDMQGHTHEGRAPFHGFKVGIGTITSASMHQFCLEADMCNLDIDRICADLPDTAQQILRVRTLHAANNIAPSVWSETAPKFIDASQLRDRLVRLREVWPDLSRRLQRQLLTPEELIDRLQVAGAPTDPEEIGISRERLKDSLLLAHSIRNRYTIHDLLYDTGLRDSAENRIFGAGGVWSPHCV